MQLFSFFLSYSVSRPFIQRKHLTSYEISCRMCQIIRQRKILRELVLQEVEYQKKSPKSQGLTLYF